MDGQRENTCLGSMAFIPSHRNVGAALLGVAGGAWSSEGNELDRRGQRVFARQSSLMDNGDGAIRVMHSAPASSVQQQHALVGAMPCVAYMPNLSRLPLVFLPMHLNPPTPAAKRHPGPPSPPRLTVGSLKVAQKRMRLPNSSTALMHHPTNSGMFSSRSKPPSSSNHWGDKHVEGGGAGGQKRMAGACHG